MSYQRLRPTFTFDADRLAQLRAIAPEAFADGKINWEALRAALGEHLEDEGADAEHFGLFWPGKRAARRRASEPPRGTLIPVPGAGVDEDTTRNLFIEADNLEALKLLQKAYAGRVKMIYIDPPYNTGNDFIYRDDFREAAEDYLRRTGQVDESLRPLTTNPRTGGRFHSNWLNMIYPRLLLARTLLRDDGVICISIGDEELPTLRMIMGELFGEENHRNTLIIRRYDKNLNRQFMNSGLRSLNVGAEYVLIYSRSQEFYYNPVYRPASEHRQEDGYWKGFWNASDRPTMRYTLLGVTPETGQWKWSQERAKKAVENYKEYLENYSGKMSLEEYWKYTGKTLEFIRKNSQGLGKNQGVESWIPPSTGILRSSNWSDILASETLTDFVEIDFDNPKNTNLIRELIRMCSEDNDIILDFFAGSGTTAHAVMAQNAEDGGNRQFILVQLAEETAPDSTAYRAGYKTISAICAERIRRAARKLAAERAGRLPDPDAAPLDLGFRFYRFAPSHFKAWQDYEGDDLAELETLFSRHETPLVDGWRAENLLTEVMLQLGFPLDSRVEPLPDFSANAVVRVSSDFHAHRLYACLDAAIAQATIDALALDADDLFVCLDSALTDQAKARLADVCNLRTI